MFSEGHIALVSLTEQMLTRRGTHFDFDHSRPGLYRLVQTEPVRAAEPFRFKDLKLVVLIDKKTLHTKVIACDAAFDFSKQRGLPKAVHKSTFECDLTGLGHSAAAERIEKLFDRMRQIEKLGGLAGWDDTKGAQMLEKYRTLSKAHVLLNRRGSQFTNHERPGTYFMVQCRWYDGIPAEPFRIKDLRLAVVVDYKTMKATALAFDDASYEPYKEKGLPVPVHRVKFDRDLSGLGHIAIANRLERLLFDVYGIDQVSGIRAA
jgi:hypothetical protein